MAKSNHLRLSDFRAIVQLVNDCRDLGDVAASWRAHLLASLARLTGAGLALGGEIGGCVRAPRVDFGTTDWGWGNGFDRIGLIRSLAEFRQNPFYSPLMNAYISRLQTANGECLSRAEMIPDREWYQSVYFQSMHGFAGADASLLCFRLVPGTTDEFSEIFFFRATGERDFSARDKSIVREAHALLIPLIGGPLARYTDPSPADLPPRARAVLRCLLDGDADKQIAARLDIGSHTVNQHIKRIFQYFGVTSRTELLARWIRRGWANGFSWAESDTD